MTARIKSRRILLTDGIFDGYVYMNDGRITAVTAEDLPFDSELDAGNDYVSPGFIDIHTHGGAGYDFSGTPEDVINACNFHLSHGTTSICPTISAAPMSVMESAVESIAAAQKDERLLSNILGAHMEGPYLSAKQCGAQSPDFITPPNPAEYKPLVERFGDVIARWTYAPENDTDGELCRYLAGHGIVVSAGHTDAIYSDMVAAIENGCSLVTHLYSATSTVTRDQGFRRPGVIETALLRDDIDAEIIADGKHLPPELIRLIVKAKGTDHVALVTDSLHLAGTNVTRGKMMATEFIIEEGVCRLLDRSAFAGSIATTDRLVRVVTGEAGFSIVDAVKMITAVPARIMGVNKGNLAAGYDADVIVFDEGINVKHAYVGGKKVV
ncbi:MAG: N-acetylglucosamine-6-phosphate deacetylase [Ruminococcaceae bacterium]|nr:N-acetylglucosamine-6-phosphate deacetylase [Oscillospiraceae bacterium]